MLTLSPEKQNAHPDPKAFSAAEVIEHFALTEEWNLGFLRKNPPTSLKGKAVKHGLLFKTAVSQMQNPVKQIATISKMTPKGSVDPVLAAKHWEVVRKEMAGFFEQVSDVNAPFAKFLFFFGTLSASDYLDLLEAHITYHEVRFPRV